MKSITSHAQRIVMTAVVITSFNFYLGSSLTFAAENSPGHRASAFRANRQRSSHPGAVSRRWTNAGRRSSDASRRRRRTGAGLAQSRQSASWGRSVCPARGHQRALAPHVPRSAGRHPVNEESPVRRCLRRSSHVPRSRGSRCQRPAIRDTGPRRWGWCPIPPPDW